MKAYFLSPLLLQKLIWIPTRLILVLFGHLEIYGLENLGPIKGNAIFAMNHSSEIDPFMVPASLPFWSRFSPLFYATRERSFYDRSGWRKYMFGGLFINSWGGYTALAGLHDYSKSLAVHSDIIRDGHSFCVFPEGGITPDGTLQPGKGGVAYLADVGQCPIVPVGVSGSYNTSVRDFFMGRKRIRISFGTPIYPDELRKAAAAEAAASGNVYKAEALEVMRRIGEEIAKRK